MGNCQSSHLDQKRGDRTCSSVLLSSDKKDLKSCDESLHPGAPGPWWLILVTSFCGAFFCQPSTEQTGSEAKSLDVEEYDGSQNKSPSTEL